MRKLLLFITLISIFTGCKCKNREAALVEIDSLKSAIARLSCEKDSLENLAEELRSYNYWFDPESDGRQMKERGIADPAGFIEKSLRDTPGAIPVEGVLGGTMHFWKIQPLGPEWVIADYEDGHIAGRAIFRYRLNSDGKLGFKLLLESEQ